jgi:YHS domain-containing protein
MLDNGARPRQQAETRWHVGSLNNETVSRRPRLSAIVVEARGETFRVVQVAGMLLVCARQNGSCCCGWDEKGRLPFDLTLWSEEWERRRIRNRLHLTFTGCLGPCGVGNNALLQLYGQAIWLKDLNDPALVPRTFDYAEAMLAAGRALPPPTPLATHVFGSFLGADTGNAADAGLDDLDPVCLMDVGPSTARFTTEYEGRTIEFCAPSCKRDFLADPAAYVSD